MPAPPIESRAPLSLADPCRRLARHPGAFAGLAYWARCGHRPLAARVVVPEVGPMMILVPIAEGLTLAGEIPWPPGASGMAGPWPVDARRRGAEWIARHLCRTVALLISEAGARGLAVAFEPMPEEDGSAGTAGLRAAHAAIRAAGEAAARIARESPGDDEPTPPGG